VKPKQVAVFENFIEKPRAIAIVGDSVFWSDTGGSLFAVDFTTNRTSTYIKRSGAFAVNMTITGLVYVEKQGALVFTQNNTILSMSVATKKVSKVAKFDFIVQNLVLSTSQSGAIEKYFFCAVNKDNSSLLTSPADKPTQYTTILSNLAVSSSSSFGLTAPRFCLDSAGKTLYYGSYTGSVYSVDLATNKPTKIPVVTGMSTFRTYIAITLHEPTAQLFLSDIYGNWGRVSVSGGKMDWFYDRTGGRYSEVWDMKFNGTRCWGSWVSINDIEAGSVNGASLRTVEASDESTVPTYRYGTYHRGGSAMQVDAASCSALMFQYGSVIFNLSLAHANLPEVPAYTYKNLRFTKSMVRLASTASDKVAAPASDRLYWFEQYQNPHAAGDNGYSSHLLTAATTSLADSTELLSSFVETQQGSMFADPATGDLVYQSTGKNRFYEVQHYCYHSESTDERRLFFTQTESYQLVNTAVDWAARELWVSGMAYRVNESNIRKVSLDAPADTDTAKVMLKNHSAVMLAVNGKTLYWVEPSRWDSRYPSNDGHFYWNNTLFSATCTSDACDEGSIVNLGQAAVFPDEFTTFKMVFDPKGQKLYVLSTRGNSVSSKVACYDVESKAWQDMPVSLMSNPLSLHATPTGLLFFDAGDRSFASTALKLAPGTAPETQSFTKLGRFGSIVNVTNFNGYNISPQWTAAGVYWRDFGPKYFPQGFARLYYMPLTPPGTAQSHPANSGGSMPKVIPKATPTPVMDFDPNTTASSSFAIDSTNGFVYFVVSAFAEYENHACDYTHPDKLVRTKLPGWGGSPTASAATNDGSAASKSDYEVLYSNPKGFCFTGGQSMQVDPGTGTIFAVISKFDSRQFGGSVPTLCAVAPSATVPSRYVRTEVDFKGAWDDYTPVSFTSVKLQLDSAVNDHPSTGDVSATETKAVAPASKTKRLYGWVLVTLGGPNRRKREKGFVVDLITGGVSIATIDRPGANCTSTNCIGKVADISIMSPAATNTAASVVTVYLSFGTGTGTNIVADIGVFSASWDLSASLSGRSRPSSKTSSTTPTLDSEYMMKTTAVLRPFSIKDMTYDFAGGSVLFAGQKLDGTSPKDADSAMWIVEAGLDGSDKRTVDIPFPSALPESLKTHVTNGIEVVPTSPRQLYLNFGTRVVYQDLWTVRGIEATGRRLPSDVTSAVPHEPTLLIPNLLPANGGGSISLQWEESQQLMHWFANGRVVTASFKTGGKSANSSANISANISSSSTTTTSVASLDYTWVPGPAYISTFVTTGIYTVLGFINGSVTLNTKNADTHSFHCLEMSVNETGWTPATMLVEDGKLYLGEKNLVYSPTAGRIRVAVLPKHTAQHTAARGQQQTKLLVFKPFIGNTSTVPHDMAVVPTRCLDALREGGGLGAGVM
jgi:hypothetical protein